MFTLRLRKNLLSCLLLAVGLPVLAATSADARADSDDVPDSGSSAILQRFLTAQQNNENALRGSSMKVDIDANVPGLHERGKLSALRRISKVGQVTYHMLGFQGDNSVKKDVIARYLQAEQQGQGDQSIAVTPTNYKFKYRGMKDVPGSRQAYVFQVTPREKKVGLFKGQLWLDTKTYLPVVEKGRLAKNPSIFFKKVDFERDFAIRDGVPVPQKMTSVIDVRLVGKVELSIDYSDYDPHGADESTDQGQAAATAATAAQ